LLSFFLAMLNGPAPGWYAASAPSSTSFQ
jgi:hypothetical protein